MATCLLIVEFLGPLSCCTAKTKHVNHITESNKQIPDLINQRGSDDLATVTLDRRASAIYFYTTCLEVLKYINN